MPASSFATAVAISVLTLWRPVVPGLERRSEERAGVKTEALRIDLTRLRVRVATARGLGERALTAREFAERTGALAVVNGGFFDPEWHPVGLRISGGRPVGGSLRPGLGALVLIGDRSARARVVLGSDLSRLGSVREALQCGPRLVLGGVPNRLKPQISRRTTAGIDAAGRLVLLVTRSGALEAGELAALLAAPEAEGGYGLTEALNLDGGGSTQLFLRSVGHKLDVPGETPVADALVVLPELP